MKAISISSPGSIDNLTYTDVNIPAINEDEVLIQVKAISINPVDVKARANEWVLNWLFGESRPAILGWDVSGEVVEVGSKVTTFKQGDAVFGMVNFVGQGKVYAEYVAARADQLTYKPTALSHSEAAAATLAALTAYQAFTRHTLVKAGQRVLIHAASGGVGHYAVQLAKYLGAFVIGTSSAANREFVLSLGADEHVDYTSEKFEDVVQGIDVVLDTIEGDTLTRSIGVLKKGGRLISIPTGNFSQTDIDLASQSGIHLTGMMVQSNGSDMAQLANLLTKGVIRSHIFHAFKFEEMGRAHLAVETGRVRGKVVVLIDEQ